MSKLLTRFHGDTLMLTLTEPQMLAELADEWTPEIDMIISALETGRGGHDGSFPFATLYRDTLTADRRAESRSPHRTTALLALFADCRDAAPHTLFTRDMDSRGIGFITRHRLPLGYSGTVRLTNPSGEETEITCTLQRCRPTIEGWFEGSLTFNRTQRQTF